MKITPLKLYEIDYWCILLSLFRTNNCLFFIVGGATSRNVAMFVAVRQWELQEAHQVPVILKFFVVISAAPNKLAGVLVCFLDKFSIGGYGRRCFSLKKNAGRTLKY
jgi:hypothetical protein